MSYCPSQDWDRYINEQDEAAMAEVKFYAEHKELLVETVCALIAAGRLPQSPDAADIKGLVNEAASIVQAVVYRGEEP